MTTSNTGLREIEVHVLFPNEYQDSVRVLAETRAEAIEQAKQQLRHPHGSLFMALEAAGPTNLATA